jgi:hypothetical protein
MTTTQPLEEQLLLSSSSSSSESNPQALGILNMSSSIIFMSQNVNADGNTLSYDQFMMYTITDAFTTPNPSELVVIPYNNRTTNNLYSSQLIANVAGFQNMSTNISISVVNGGSTTPVPSPTPSSGSKSGPSSHGLAIAIVEGIGIFFILIAIPVLAGIFQARRRQGRNTTWTDGGGANGYPSSTASAVQPPRAQFDSTTTATTSAF